MKVHAIQTGTVAVKTRQREGKGRGPARVARTLIDRNWTDPLQEQIQLPSGRIQSFLTR